MKNATKEVIDGWKEKMTEDSISVNFTEEIVKIYTKIILMALLGEDLSSETVEFDDLTTGVTSTLELHQALRLPLPICVTLFYNPLRMFSPIFHGMRMTKSEHRVQKNCRNLRNLVREYMLKRKSGEKPSQVQGTDLLSFLLEDQTIFKKDQERIIDQLLDFFVAGTQTVALLS